MKKTRLISMLLAVLILSTCFASAFAEEASTEECKWPEKPVTIIVPYNPGGDSDFTARLLAEKLSEKTGKSFVVENIAGNSGAVGVRQALESDPDGYTIAYMHTAFLVNYFSGCSTLTYDDMTFGTVCGFYDDTVTMGLYAVPELGITKLSELLAYTKEHPGELLYGASSGTTNYVLGCRMLENGFDVTVVDTGDASERTAAILGKHVDIVHGARKTMADYVAAGQVVELENDLGITNITCSPYYQMNFPKGTDANIVAKLDSLLEDIIFNDEDYAARIKEAYDMLPFYLDAEEGLEFMTEKWDEFATFNWQ